MSKTNYLIRVLCSLLVSYFVTGMLLLLFAYAMYKLGLGEKTVNYAITFVYIFASAVGGLVIGKSMKEKKFLWGFLVGALYVAIIFVVSLAMTGSGHMIAVDGVSTTLLCVAGGTLGGMIS